MFDFRCHEWNPIENQSWQSCQELLQAKITGPPYIGLKYALEITGVEQIMTEE